MPHQQLLTKILRYAETCALKILFVSNRELDKHINKS